MSDESSDIAAEQIPGQPTEDQIRAAMEEEMRRIHVGDVVLQTVVTLVQLAGRRLGGTPETEPERDLDQARIAIDSVAALLGSVEAVAPSQVDSVRNALSQLQLAYVKAGGTASTAADPTAPEAAGSPQSPGADGGDDASGSRLWVPPGVR